MLDLVHTDICGPMQTVTQSGNKYFLTLIDDYSRYTVVYLLREKSNVFGKKKVYVETIKNKFGKFSTFIRSDIGCEYKSQRLIEYLQENGIRS